MGAAKIKISDGTEITDIDSEQATQYTHTFSSSSGKDSSQGIKTRYLIYYFTNTELSQNFFGIYSTLYANAIYMYLKNLTITADEFFYNAKLMQYIKCKNVTFSASTLSFENDYNLVGIEGMNCTNVTWINYKNCYACSDRFKNIDSSKITDLSYAFSSYYGNNAVFPDELDMSKVTNYDYCFYNFKSETINKLDFTSCATSTNWLMQSSYLISIGEITGKIMNDLSIKGSNNYWNHDSLIKFINALNDYSESTDTHTFTMGTFLYNLTNDEQAIATNKGWTLSV